MDTEELWVSGNDFKFVTPNKRTRSNTSGANVRSPINTRRRTTLALGRHTGPLLTPSSDEEMEEETPTKTIKSNSFYKSKKSSSPVKEPVTEQISSMPKLSKKSTNKSSATVKVRQTATKSTAGRRKSMLAKTETNLVPRSPVKKTRTRRSMAIVSKPDISPVKETLSVVTENVTAEPAAVTPQPEVKPKRKYVRKSTAKIESSPVKVESPKKSPAKSAQKVLMVKVSTDEISDTLKASAQKKVRESVTSKTVEIPPSKQEKITGDAAEELTVEESKSSVTVTPSPVKSNLKRTPVRFIKTTTVVASELKQAVTEIKSKKSIKVSRRSAPNPVDIVEVVSKKQDQLEDALVEPPKSVGRKRKAQTPELEQPASKAKTTRSVRKATPNRISIPAKAKQILGSPDFGKGDHDDSLLYLTPEIQPETKRAGHTPYQTPIVATRARRAAKKASPALDLNDTVVSQSHDVSMVSEDGDHAPISNAAKSWCSIM